jgi:hypothetical protein
MAGEEDAFFDNLIHPGVKNGYRRMQAMEDNNPPLDFSLCGILGVRDAFGSGSR